MKIQRQLNKHDPDNGVYGDCHRTCIAMILNMDAEDIPNLCHPDNDNWLIASNEWLATRGLREATLNWHKHDVTLHSVIAGLPSDVPYILGCLSSNGFNHSVVVYQGEIINPNDSSVVGPMDDDFWRVTFLAAA